MVIHENEARSSLWERENVRGLLGMATCRKWRWDYIPAITITYLKSVRLLDSIMLYLMGGTASRVWHDIRGQVNIYPVRFLKCPDLQWPLYCPPHIYCRALATAIRVYFCLSSREQLRFHACILRPRILQPHRVSRAYIFKEGLTIKHIQDRRSNEIRRAAVN